MPLFYDTAGIPIQLATPQVNYGALANVRPLSWGQNPIQISANAQWVVPEGKPYIAQGIGQAAQGIAHGMDVAAQAKREEARQRAAIELEGKKEAAATAKEKARQTFEAEQHRLNRENALEVAKAKVRIEEVGVYNDAPGFTKSDTDKPPKVDFGVVEGAPMAAKADVKQPVLPTPLTKAPSPTIPWQRPELPAPLKIKGVSLATSPVAIAAPVAPAAPAAAPAPVLATNPEAVIQESTAKLPESLVPAGVDLTSAPALGSKEASKDNSRVKALMQTPDLGKLEDVQPPSAKQKPAEFRGVNFQEVNPNHRKVSFKEEGPAAAYLHAAQFNNMYRNSAEEAVVKPKSKEIPYYTVEYKDLGDKRLESRERAAAHKSTEEAKAATLEFKRDVKAGNMAKNYEADPTTKLMATREDAMRRMLVAYQEDHHAREEAKKGMKPTKSLSTIHQEMKELFVMFASGKAPTEAQFKEISHAFPGFERWYAKKSDFFNKGATLDQVDVNTIRDLMVKTYNDSAGQINSELNDISYLLKKDHPNLDPIRLPVQYPILETEEYLKEQLDEISHKAQQNPKLTESLKPEVENLVRKIESVRQKGLPSNYREFAKPARKSGFHSFLFSASPDMSNPQPAPQ